MAKVILGAFLGIGLLIFIGVAISPGGRSPTVSQTSSGAVESAGHRAESEPLMPVSAVKLWSDYQANEVAADNAYKGRRLLVSGMISGIKKDFTEHTFLTLASPNEFMDVHADLVDEYVSEAANLHQGQMIVLECEGAGMIIGSPVLKDCSFHLEAPRESGANDSLTSQPKVQEDSPTPTSNASPVFLPSSKVSELMKEEERLNGECRSGAHDDQTVQKACTDRETLLNTIKAQGWCWGHEDQSEAEKKWEFCGSQTQ